MNSNKKSLYDSITDVQESIDSKERGRQSGKRGLARLPVWFRPGLLVAAVVTLLAVKYFTIDSEARIIHRDFKLAAQQLFKQADSLVTGYYRAYSNLPEELPDAALSPYVLYEKLGEYRYALELNYVPYNRRFIRDMDSIDYPTGISEFVNDVIP